MGRKSKFTQAAAAVICSKLSQGIPLTHICRGEGMPCVRSVSDWRLAHAFFDAAFARAREEGYDAIAAECLRIADTPLEGKEVTIKPGGKKETKVGDMLGHRKLQIETRLKLLARWDPKRYGDSLKVEGSGEGGALLVVVKDYTGRKKADDAAD